MLINILGAMCRGWLQAASWDLPFLISVRFHWPMQGPQAFASTVPPTLLKTSMRPSRSMVALICSLPGVMVKGTCAQMTGKSIQSKYQQTSIWHFVLPLHARLFAGLLS